MSDTKEPRPDSQATVLVRLALRRFRLIVGDDGLTYAVPTDGHVARPLRGGRHGLRAALAAAYVAEYARAPTQTALADCLTVLEGMAYGLPSEPVHLRVGRDGDRLVLDLAHPEDWVVIVGPDGWDVHAQSPVLFRRTALTKGQVPPRRCDGTGLARARALAHMPDASWRLLVAWMVAALIPDIPRPVLVILGEMGTAKTSTARLVIDLIDPSAAVAGSPPKDPHTWVTTAAGRYVVCVDNVSRIPEWWSDAICRAVTGDGWQARSLFTDSELTVLAFRRALVFTSIDAGAMRGDLAERLVTITLDVIPDTARREEAELDAEWDRVRPDALADLLTLLSQVLEAMPDVRMTRRPRMADFARVLAAVDQVTGWDTLSTYVGRMADTVADVVESDLFASAVRDLAVRRGQWEGTSAELARDVAVPEPRPKWWPSSGQAAAGALRRLAPALRAVGVGVELGLPDGRGRARVIRLAGPEARRGGREAGEAGEAGGENVPAGQRHDQSPRFFPASPLVPAEAGEEAGDRSRRSEAHSPASPLSPLLHPSFSPPVSDPVVEPLFTSPEAYAKHYGIEP